MANWLQQIRDLLATGTSPRLFHRRVRLSPEVLAWLRDPTRTNSDLVAFAEMLLRLDADPTKETFPLLRVSAPPGMRWTAFEDYTAIFVIDMGANQITIVSCL